MIGERAALSEVMVLTPRIHRDERGFLFEAFNRRTFGELGLPVDFAQDNHTRSHRCVLRGLHYQLRRPQGKLVRVARGAIFDVAVDVRRGSPTFGRWVSVELSEDDGRMLWIPPGFAHGFCVLSEVADVIYKCTELYDPEDDRGIRWDDPRLAIPWPVGSPIVSAKDAALPILHPERGDLPAYGR